MVIPASTSYLSFCRLYFGSHSKIGTKYCNVFFVFIKPFGSCDIGLNGSSGKKVSLHLQLNLRKKLLGAEKFTPRPFGVEEFVLSLSMVTKPSKQEVKSLSFLFYIIELVVENGRVWVVLYIDGWPEIVGGDVMDLFNVMSK